VSGLEAEALVLALGDLFGYGSSYATLAGDDLYAELRVELAGGLNGVAAICYEDEAVAADEEHTCGVERGGIFATEADQIVAVLGVGNEHAVEATGVELGSNTLDAVLEGVEGVEAVGSGMFGFSGVCELGSCHTKHPCLVMGAQSIGNAVRDWHSTRDYTINGRRG
jgi:hypothetical protein